MALPATDDFASDFDPITGDSNWGLIGALADPGEAASGVYTDGSGNTADKAAYWTADSFSNNQYSQIKMTEEDTSNNARLGVILWGGSGNAALLIRFRTATANQDFEPYYYDTSGARNSLGTAHAPSAFNVGDIMRAEIASDTLSLFLNIAGAGFPGTADATWSTASMTNGPTTGAPGIYIVHGTSGTSGDDWEGGDLAAAGGGVIITGQSGGMTDMAGGLSG